MSHGRYERGSKGTSSAGFGAGWRGGFAPITSRTEPVASLCFFACLVYLSIFTAK